MTFPSDRLYPQCVITGCAMQVGNAYAWGDLHELGDTWIFNGVPTKDARMVWVHYPPAADQKILIVTNPDATFTRRGLCVIPKSCAELNLVAKRHIAGAPA
ncbi:MAG: hypothetical protein AB7U98_13685 [Candidatus Nitrosocosmicus sp.]